MFVTKISLVIKKKKENASTFFKQKIFYDLKWNRGK